MNHITRMLLKFTTITLILAMTFLFVINVLPFLVYMVVPAGTITASLLHFFGGILIGGFSGLLIGIILAP